VIDTSVVVAGIAGMKHTTYASNVASAHLLQRSVDTKPFVSLNNQLAGQVLAEAGKLCIAVADVRGDKILA